MRKQRRHIDAWYQTQAKQPYHDEGTTEIDDDATVSRGADGGAYVQAWVWVANDSEGTTVADDSDEEETA